MHLREFLNCLSCGFILLFCSIQNLWGVINVYVYSYLREYDASLKLSDMNLIYFWFVFASNTGIQFGLMCAYKIGFRQTIILAGLLAPLFILLSSVTNTLLTFSLTFAVANLFFTGLTYLIAIDRAFKLFPKHPELVSGVINAIYGVGLMVSGEMTYLLINPDDQSVVEDQDFYPISVSSNLPSSLRILALIYGGLAVIAFLLYNKKSFMEAPPLLGDDCDGTSDLSAGTNHNLEQSDVLKVDSSCLPPSLSENLQETQELFLQNSSNLKTNRISDEISSEHNECSSIKQGILSVPFIFTFLLVFFVGNFGTMIIGNYKPYGQIQIDDDSFLTLVGTISGLINGLSGLVWGPILTKIHFKYVLYAMLLINAICAALYPSLSYSKTLYFILTAISLFCYGGIYTVFPILVVSLFGEKYGTRMLGFFYQGLTVTSLFSYILLENVSNWDIVFYLYSGFSVIGLVFARISPVKVKWRNPNELSTKQPLD